MKKIIKTDENLKLLRELADLAFYKWNEVDREYPFASYEAWNKARKEFEEARDAHHEYKLANPMEKKMNRFVKELKSVIAGRVQTKMLQLSDKIHDAEENGYDLSDEEELLMERMTTILDKM